MELQRPLMDPARFREEFPVLADKVHLASCSQGARSARLDAALQSLLTSMSDQGAPWGDWMAQVEASRLGFADLIGTPADSIAVLPNASVAAFQAISTFDFAARDTILTTALEFPSVGNVWHAQRPRGARIRMVPQRRGAIDVDEVLAAIDERTALVSVPLVTYHNGALLFDPRISERAREAGAQVFVDAYQGAGVVPIDAAALDVDFLVAGSLKYLLGLPGSAYLYARPGAGGPVPVSCTGWFGRSDPFAFDATDVSAPATARRFETGTPAIPSAYAANAGFGLLSEVDQRGGWRHVQELVRLARGELQEAGYRLADPDDERLCGPMTTVRCTDPDAIAARLSERGIFTSPRGELLRISFHYYNTVEDVRAVLAALAEVAAPVR